MNKAIQWMVSKGKGEFKGSLPGRMVQEVTAYLAKAENVTVDDTDKATTYVWVEDGIEYTFIAPKKAPFVERLTWRPVEDQVTEIRVREDEQRAVSVAIERERRPAIYCPDCGRAMEQDGGAPYCEYCEG